MESEYLKKTTMFIMLIIAISKFMGFGREILLSYFYGASYITDAFIISRTIPFLLFEFVGIAIVTSYLPIVSEIKQNKDENEVERFTNNLVSLVSILSTVIVIFVVIFATPIVKVFAAGFSGETLKIAVIFTRISVLGIYFTAYVYVFRGYLHYKRNFFAPELIGLPLNIVLMVGIVISYNLGAIHLAISGVLATFAQFIFLIPSIKRNKLSYKFIFNPQDSYIRKMISLSLPVMIGVSINQINLLVDRTIASGIYVGGISALNYANRLNIFIQSIFVMSIANVLYPMISDMAATKNWHDLKKLIVKVINTISILVTPITIGTLIFAGEIVQLLFGRGAFDEHAIFMTTSALFFYSIGMMGFGLREILSRTFYSMQDTKTPMINASIGMIINIILNIVLSRFLGIGGLALATSIAATITTILLFMNLRKKIGPFGIKQISISFLKVLLASLVMGLLAKLSFDYLTSILSQNLSLLIAIGVGAVLYFAIIYFMKIEEVDVIVGVIKKKIGLVSA